MTIQEIEEEIYSLCCQRAQLLEDEGVSEPYLVFDNNQMKFNENVLVLNPIKDREILLDIFSRFSEPEKSVYLSWLEDYYTNSCKDLCPITHTPICCKVCSSVQDCEYSLVRCGSYGDTGECEKRGKYSEGK